MLDAVLNERDASRLFDTSTINAFHRERMQVANSFDEFLANAPRTLDYVDDGSAPGEYPALEFADDSAAIFNNELPLSLWLRAAQSKTLTANLRATIAQPGFVRGVVLGTSPNAFAALLAHEKPAYAADMAAIERLTDKEQGFAAVYWILHHPELQKDVRPGLLRQTPDAHIDDYRQNWWCGRRNPGQSSPDFLTSEERKENSDQQAALANASDSVQFLSEIVVRWTETHPADSRDAEALALSVKTSKYACYPRFKTNHSAVERAFQLLHERYPETSWAKSTPYWS